MITTDQELAVRGLLLDAMTCLKSAHEEMLRGNYQRADMFMQKSEVILTETRAAGQILASQGKA